MCVLEFCFNKLFEGDINNIRSRLGQNNIDKFVLMKCTISNECYRLLFNSTEFMNNSSLKHLKISSRSINSDGLKILVDSLLKVNNLTTLDLSNNRVGDNGLKHISDLIKVDDSLETIHLTDNDITDEGFNYFMESLKENTRIKQLYIFNGNDDISEDSIRKFRTMFCDRNIQVV